MRDMPRWDELSTPERRRYLLKALGEVGHRITRLVASTNERMLDSVPPGEEWSIVQLVGFLRDSEREDLAALKAMIRVDGARIKERRALYGPAEHHYDSDEIEDLLWEFAMLREETLYLLDGAGSQLRHVGVHPYQIGRAHV